MLGSLLRGLLAVSCAALLPSGRGGCARAGRSLCPLRRPKNAPPKLPSLTVGLLTQQVLRKS